MKKTAVFGVLLVLLIPSATALASYDEYRDAWKEVRKQERDLSKAKASLRKELRQRDYRGIRKAQHWVRKEQQDLREARAELREYRQYRPPRYRLHHSYQQLPKHRYGNDRFKYDDCRGRSHDSWHRSRHRRGTW